jgi:hypothetical protein
MNNISHCERACHPLIAYEPDGFASIQRSADFRDGSDAFFGQIKQVPDLIQRHGCFGFADFGVEY